MEVGSPARSAEGAVPVGLLESFVPRDRRIALAAGEQIPDRARGACLFADISGFTPLTEALATEHGPQRGAEELDRVLNDVYTAIVGDLESRRGVVIYFSGDAITCWLDGDDGRQAVQCALDMQETMRRVGRAAVPGGAVELRIKIAVAVGSIRRLVVGDPDSMRLDVLAGRLAGHLASAEALAEPGDVTVDESVLDELGDGIGCTAVRIDPESGRRVGVVDRLAVPPPPLEPLPLAIVPPDLIRPWLLPALYERLVVGGGLFLAELRTAHPIFVRFAGFDYDDDPDVESALDEFIRAVQHVLDRYDGTLLGITIGDKGAYLNAVVGTPRSHEDDAHRAVAAALEICDLTAQTRATDIQVGVSVGRVYSGTYGHPDRQTMSVLGDPTNVAARLMSKAPPGQVYVLGEVADEISDRFTWIDLPPLALKGKTEPVRVRVPVAARRTIQRVRRYPLPMVGRDRELDVVRREIAAAAGGACRVLGISGAAGVGKSRFVAEVLRDAARENRAVAVGQAESLGQISSYAVWRSVWQRLLGVDDESPEAAQAGQLERAVRAIDDSLGPRVPLLGSVLGLDLPDNELVARFDAKLRKASLENLLGELLARRLARGPLLIVLENLEWIDPLSLELLDVLVRRVADLPAMFLLAHRPDPEGTVGATLATLPGLTEIELGELTDDNVRDVVNAKVSQVFGAGTIASGPVIDLVLGRAQGNPFYAEELINYMHRVGLDPSDPGSVEQLDLPASLRAIVLSRIDGLAEHPRQAVKVGSIVGQQFTPSVLSTVHAPLGNPADVVEHLEVGRDFDLVLPESEARDEWLFRHTITRDVAYESIPFGVRGPLHERIGDEIATGPGLSANLDVIAHHYWHGENIDKQREFLRRAGLAARDAYANETAIGHFRRLASIVEGGARVDALLELSGVLELVGRWDEAETAAQEARELAVETGDAVRAAWSLIALGEIARKRGQYEYARDLLVEAEQIFAEHDDPAGSARALHLLGTVAAQHGELAEARRLYEQSEAIRTDIGDVAGLAALQSNLGVVANYEGDLEQARAHHRRSLELRRDLGDRWAIAVSYNNLGIIEVGEGNCQEAHRLFTKAMQLCVEVGDTWLIAIVDNNLANALRGLDRPDEARRHYGRALDVYRRHNDRWALAFLFEDLVALAAVTGATGDALEFLGVADAMRDAIEAVRPDSQTSDLDEVLDPKIAGWDPADVERRRAAGRALDTDDALARAERFCRDVG